MTTKLLIVTRHTPLPWEDGAGAYLHDLARYLATHGFRVEILWLAPHDDLRWQKCWRLPDAFDSSVRLLASGAIRCGRYYFFPHMMWHPLKAKARQLVRRLMAAIGFARPQRPLTATPAERPWMSPPSLGELAIVARHVQARPPAVVIVSYAWMCPVFELPAMGGVHGVCLTNDVAWHRAQLASATAGEPAAITRENEAAWLQSAGTIIAISAADASEFHLLAPSARVLVAPKSCTVPATAPAAPDFTACRLLFVGSGNLFNVAGLDWFLREVWPLVVANLPDIRLDVCGSISRALPLRPAGVTFHGSVPDLAPFYRTATVIIVPLLQASGLNIKLIDAAAAGRAIVASTVTLAGAPFLRGAVHSADTAAGFADAVWLLLTDAGANAQSASAGFAAVRAHLSPAACYGPLADHLRSAA